jgi:hypothetical protein
MPKRFNTDDERRQFEKERKSLYRLKKQQVGQVEVGQVEVGQVEVGQVEVGQVEVGQVEVGQVDEEEYTRTYNSGKYVLREDYDKLYEECKRFQEKGLQYKRLALCYEKNIQNELIYYYKMKHYKLYWYCLREIEDEPNIEWVDIKYHLGVKRSLIEERDLYYDLLMDFKKKA